jgi:hypothetical protein
MKILVLDDSKRRQIKFKELFIGDSVDIAENIEEAKVFLSNYIYDQIYLDHDLLPEHYGYDCYDGTGKELVDWIIENESNINSEIIVHSFNDSGAKYMVESLLQNSYNVIRKKVTELGVPI